MTFFFNFLLFVFLIVCAVLSFSILIQESKSTGLGSIMGGDSSDSLFGTSTADVLKKFTTYLAVIFMSGCVFLSIWTSALGKQKTATPVEVQEVQEK